MTAYVGANSWRGLPRHTGRWRNLEVAIKVVSIREQWGAADIGARNQIVMEVAVARAIVHPNVVGCAAQCRAARPASVRARCAAPPPTA